MDFFGEQEQARRQTRWLIALFVMAVAAVIVAVYLAMIVVIGADGEQPLSFWNGSLFLAVAAATTLFISGGSLYKISALASGGGESVAEALGGRLVSRASGDFLEKRLLNVVDEMAIASGVPTPKVFILDDEHGINAFAAGFTTQQAVVAVTRGTLEQLSRDELQGVIAHEFSHILNGDMRLNLRLIGILHGILLLALIGRILLRGGGRGRSKNGGGIVFFGLALLAIGYIGVFFGNLIKAAASRQREFLADASAVQFTRNPDGIGGALKKIGGFEQSAIHHPKAEEASHFFLAKGSPPCSVSWPPIRPSTSASAASIAASAWSRSAAPAQAFNQRRASQALPRASAWRSRRNRWWPASAPWRRVRSPTPTS